MAALRHSETSPLRIHVEVAAVDVEGGVVNLEGHFLAGERDHEIRHAQITLRAHDGRPLFVRCDEGTVEAGRHAVLEKQFAGEFRGHGGGAAWSRDLVEETSGHAPGHLPLHGPECEADVIPAQVAQAAERFHGTVGPDVAGEEFRRRTEAKRGRDALEVAHARAVVQHFAHTRQTRAVHEHHAVDELHLMATTRFDHFAQIRHARRAGLLAHDVFACGRGTQHPLLAQSGGQRDVHGVHIFRGEQFLIAAHRTWRHIHRRGGLTLGDEAAALLQVAARNGDDRGVAGVGNGLPVFARDLRGAEDAPAKFVLVHE